MSGLKLFLKVREAFDDTTVTTPYAVPTTDMYIDYLNGQKIDIYDESDRVVDSYYSVGFVNGSMVTIISDSGLGKSSWTIKAACGIASQFENSFVVHEDVENAASIVRVRNVSNQPASWMRNSYVIESNCHGDNVLSRIISHAEAKLNNRKMFEIPKNKQLKDIYGDPIQGLIPTVVILDSLAIMRSKGSMLEESVMLKGGKEADKRSESVMNNNMAGARNAKYNSEFFKQILSWLREAGIILLVINHITKKVETGFVSSARDIAGLSESESLPGGRAAVYLSNNLLRFKNAGKLEVDKDYGINGNKIKAEFYKSRTSVSLRDVELIFDKTNGFSNILTGVHNLIKSGKINESGRGKYTVPGSDTVFTKKNVRQKCQEDPSLIVALYDAIYEDVQDLIAGTNVIENSDKLMEKGQYEEIMTELLE